MTGNEAPLQAAAIGALEGSHLTLVDTTVAANGAGAEGAIVAGTGSDVAVRDATLAAGAGAALGLGAATSAEVEGSIVSGAPGISCAPGVVVSSSGPGIVRGGAAGCTTAGVPPGEADPVLGAPTQTGLVTVLPLLRGRAAVNAGGASCPGARSKAPPWTSAVSRGRSAPVATSAPSRAPPTRRSRSWRPPTRRAPAASSR